jgi:ABC-2 type transport system ATP-binding protein
MARAIQVKDLRKAYGTVEAVAGISFEVVEGECFALLGPNGAGKTTTFSCLTRQIPITSGRVSLLGHDVAREFAAVKPRFGYVPDVENHFDEFTAGQNLRIYADLYRAPRKRIDECLEMVELRREKDIPVRAFSKGMRKKLLLARELLHEPELLLLDEPTANLDVHSTELIRHIIQRLSKRGVTILITTHNMPEVEQVCDRVAIINRGKLIALDSPTGFKARNTERVVDVVLERDGGHERLAVNLTDDGQRREFARLLGTETPITLHTREFNFYQVFLKLTGDEYN